MYRVFRAPDRAPEIRGETIGLPPEEPLGRELRAFTTAVAKGEEPPCTGADGFAALELALRIRDAIERQPQ